MLAMEEDEEVHFKRPDTVPDTPRVSRTNSPDREEGDDREVKDYTAVLEMVKIVRDRLTALVLDNTNIRAACDDLRRQCHSQGVAFGDLSRLVKQSREDQEDSRADTWEETRPHPRIRPELLDGGGNLRARDIGITWQDGDTFLHGVRIIGQRDDMEDNRRRPATAAPYPPCPEELEDARRQPAMSTPYHPESDGMIERFNRTCLMMLSMFVNDRRDNWHELLPFIMHAYRTSVHESTGYSPFRLMMGEECSLPQDASTAELRTQRENDVAPHPFATWVRDALEVAYDHVRSSLRKTASRRKRLYDTKAVNRKFPVGSWVLRYYPPAAQHKLGITVGRASSGCSTGHRSYGWHSTGRR